MTPTNKLLMGGAAILGIGVASMWWWASPDGTPAARTVSRHEQPGAQQVTRLVHTDARTRVIAGEDTADEPATDETSMSYREMRLRSEERLEEQGWVARRRLIERQTQRLEYEIERAEAEGNTERARLMRLRIEYLDGM